MIDHSLPYLANCSLLFTEEPLLRRPVAALEDHGYRGWVSPEYRPTGTTEASLAWLPRERRAGKEQS
jgi:hydroxypyruvate isomerase